MSGRIYINAISGRRVSLRIEESPPPHAERQATAILTPWEALAEALGLVIAAVCAAVGWRA